MKVGDRVRVTHNYLRCILFMPVRGKTGIVTAITPRFIDVRMDDGAVDGIQDYLFKPSELEVI